MADENFYTDSYKARTKINQPEIAKEKICGSKKSYQSKSEAEAFIQVVYNRDPLERRNQLLVSYPCPICDGIHIGHKKPKKSK